MDFRVPFAEVDTMRLSAGFNHGVPSGPRSEFWINGVHGPYEGPWPQPTIR